MKLKPLSTRSPKELFDLRFNIYYVNSEQKIVPCLLGIYFNGKRLGYFRAGSGIAAAHNFNNFLTQCGHPLIDVSQIQKNMENKPMTLTYAQIKVIATHCYGFIPNLHIVDTEEGRVFTGESSFTDIVEAYK